MGIWVGKGKKKSSISKNSILCSKQFVAKDFGPESYIGMEHFNSLPQNRRPNCCFLAERNRLSGKIPEKWRILNNLRLFKEDALKNDVCRKTRRIQIWSWMSLWATAFTTFLWVGNINLKMKSSQLSHLFFCCMAVYGLLRSFLGFWALRALKIFYYYYPVLKSYWQVSKTLLCYRFDPQPFDPQPYALLLNHYASKFLLNLIFYLF